MDYNQLHRIYHDSPPFSGWQVGYTQARWKKEQAYLNGSQECQVRIPLPDSRPLNRSRIVNRKIYTSFPSCPREGGEARLPYLTRRKSMWVHWEDRAEIFVPSLFIAYEMLSNAVTSILKRKHVSRYETSDAEMAATRFLRSDENNNKSYFTDSPIFFFLP